MPEASVIHATEALLPDGWAANVRIALAHGRIAAVTRNVPPAPGDERHAVVIPGMANLHSHAFQRAMAGLAEQRGSQIDSFWSWRELMYRLALRLTPDEVEAVAGWLYAQMLEAGFTRVGEFHYLHHAPDGRPYDDLGEMAGRIAAAAETTGIGLTLLPVFYAHAGFGGRPSTPEQRRFICDGATYARLWERSQAIVARLDGATLGVAPHSLRAVTPDELGQIVALAPHGPIHIHVAEQTGEVEDCLAHTGQRPVQWLLEHQRVDHRWCLIHATHMTEREVTGVARSGATVGLCPVTEANLGDGIFAGAAYVAAGGQFGVGTDSNILIGVAGELRQLEYSQRLALRQRNVLAAPQVSTGRALFDQALAGGARALAVDAGIKAGAPADLVALRSPIDLPLAGDQCLDSWIFADGMAVDAVVVGGRRLVRDGVHIHREALRGPFLSAMRRILS